MPLAQQLWDNDFALDILPRILRAVPTTIIITILGMALALALGLVFAVIRRAGNPWLRRAQRGVVEFIRSTPILVQLFFVFFALPIMIPAFTFSAFRTGVVVLGVHYATYTSEVYRAGIDAVPRGQWEAARALNFSTTDTWRRIVMPQAIPPIVPAMGNYLISMFKDSPQLLAIGVAEILSTAQDVGNEQFRFLEPFTIAALIFLVLSYASSLFVRWLERRFGAGVGV